MSGSPICDAGVVSRSREPVVVGQRTFVDVTGGPVEVETTAGDPGAPTLVFLHEGLGSVDLWRAFPADVAERVGRPRVVVYSRHGHGRSGPAQLPRTVDYMHHEADVVLPELLAALRIDRPVLIGHSDGASIALLFAGAGGEVQSLACVAPHVFVEPESVSGIEAAKFEFESTDMAAKMARYHDEPEATFRGWNDVWLSPGFRSWNIEERLAGIVAPVLLVQGTDDRYGTMAQLDAIEAGVSGASRRVVIDGGGHAPHLHASGEVASAIADLVRDLH